MTKLGLGTVAALVALAVALVAAPAGTAKDGDIRVRGTCTKASTSKLKLSEEDGRIEVEFEVDQDRNGVRWNVVLRQRGKVVFRGTRTTRGPSGSFTVRRLLPDRPGPDRITARATRRSGEVCRASAVW